MLRIDDPPREESLMTIQRRSTVLSALLAIVALVAACGGSSGPLGSVPAPSSTAEPSVVLGSPDLTPAPSQGPSTEPTTSPDGSIAPSPSPSPSSGSTGKMTVRAYFWLDGPPGSAGPVAVLREIPATKGVASAALSQLLAGPTAGETSRKISSQIPDGTQLLGLTIDKDGLATVDLSSEFTTGGPGAAYQTRLAQVVYTLTQFPTVRGVMLLIEGTGDSIALKRGDYVDLLPDIWVDRPAFNAAIGNPAHVTGNADVFEAAFRIAILDGSGKTLADEAAMASCGSGCRGTFDVTIPYTLTKAQYGILRVYNPSAQDGTPESVRDYRVWLTPKG
jgi:hypothetical protein